MNQYDNQLSEQEDLNKLVNVIDLVVPSCPQDHAVTNAVTHSTTDVSGGTTVSLLSCNAEKCAIVSQK